nr:hypothetical protein [Marinicella sp. W31]MDC2879014.1 hypothetical protein [Marinicella sp. W31]
MQTIDCSGRTQRSAPGSAEAAPSASIWPKEIADDAGHHIANDILGIAAGLFDDGNIKITLLRVRLDLRLGNIIKTGAAQKAGKRLFRRADARALALLAHISGTRRQPVDIEDQAPRREIFARALIGQPRIHQRIGDALFQLACRLALHAGRNFLGSKFKQKIGHWGDFYRVQCSGAAVLASSMKKSSGNTGFRLTAVKEPQAEPQKPDFTVNLGRRKRGNPNLEHTDRPARNPDIRRFCQCRPCRFRTPRGALSQ